MGGNSKTKTAVIGASGYSGSELLRILFGHPGCDLVAVTSRQYAGQTLVENYPRFRGIANAESLSFIDPAVESLVSLGVEVAFLALPHGVAAEFAVPLLEKGIRVIDLSADFRLSSTEVYREFYDAEHPAPKLLDEAVYGLPEVYADRIQAANLVASPGCYPTSILIPTLPLLREGLIDASTIQVFSMSGVSGAGRKASVPLLFVECNESVRAYSVPKHRHLSEIEQEMSLAAGSEVVITFTPHLVPVSRGICSTTYASLAVGSDLGTVTAALEEAYAEKPFVRLLGPAACPDTKNVVGTNFVDVGWSVDVRTGRVILMSCEDNIVKGASGQAVQSFNLMTGSEETSGLL